jgi:hypothetical protein
VTVTDDEDPEARCELETPPAPPTIVTPALGELRQPGENIRFEAAAPPVATGDDARISEFEVWLLAAGEPAIRVWSGSVSGDTESATLDLNEGEFDAGFDTLDTWKSYGVRARYRDGGALCDFGAWSDYQPFRIDDGSEALFDDQIIRDVEITLPQESFDAINAEALPPECVPYHRNYYPGTVTFDGTTYEGAGVRVKGGCGSSRDLSGKAAFKVNLSDYGSGTSCPTTRRARGLKRLTLNNQVQDRSFIHERLAYHLYDLVGVPVPRRAPIRVHVNGELWGLYLHLESIDRRFFERRYDGAAARGMAYEGTYFCDITQDNMPPVDGPETCFDLKFSAECSDQDPDGDPYNYQPLREFADLIVAKPDGEFYPDVESYMEFDTFLSQWAAETIMNHWDSGIFDILNNYRVYHNPLSGKWVMLPTGLDQSWNQDQRPIDPWQPNSIIARRCLQESDCEAAFAARLKEVLTIFENANMAAMAENLRAQISAEVQADPRREGTFDSFNNNVDRTIEFINNRPAQINAWLAEHGY